MNFNGRASTATSRLQKIALMLFGMVLSIVLLELMLRGGGLIWTSAQEYRNSCAVQKRGTYKILCLGESTTAGEYPVYLEEALNRQAKGIRFSVIDKGIPGTRTDSILAVLGSNLDRYHPDMVITMMGINDGASHLPREPISHSVAMRFFRSWHVYKLFQFLGLHIQDKLSELSHPVPCVTSGISQGFSRGRGGAGTAVAMTVEQANVYRDEGEFYKAEAGYKMIIQAQPDLETAHVELGHLYYLQKRFPEMKTSFAKALELNPGDDRVCRELGYFLREQGRFSEAILWYQKAIAIDPRNVRSCIGLGNVYQSQRRFPEAESWYQKAATLDPSNDKIFGTMAVLYDEMRNAPRAAECRQRARDLRSGHFDLRPYDSAAAGNYQKLRQVLRRRGITYVCAQYPMRDLASLKQVFGGDTEGIVFVDNGRIFREAVQKEGYKEYFRDMFGGDFGHCTEKGNRFLAQNIAETILKEVFHQ